MIRAVSHAKKARLKNEFFLSTTGLEPTFSRLLDWRSIQMCYRVLTLIHYGYVNVLSAHFIPRWTTVYRYTRATTEHHRCLLADDMGTERFIYCHAGNNFH